MKEDRHLQIHKHNDRVQLQSATANHPHLRLYLFSDLLSQGATGPQRCQLWRHGQGLGSRHGLRDGVVGAGRQDARGAAHLLGQEHGAVGQLVGLGAHLLPHRDLLG